MQTKNIAETLSASLVGAGSNTIENICTDSRTLTFPEKTLFVAIKTAKNDGHKYIDSLYDAGVRSFLVSTLPENQHADACYILVDDTLQSLQKLAEQTRKSHNIPTIGITGSNGKTIVKEWLFQLLHKDNKICRSPRSYNSQIGVPLSVLNLSNSDTLAIFEAGISQMNEMDKLARIVSPTIGVFTTLGEAHSENFPSQKVKCLEKLKLFKGAKSIVYGSDNKLVDICMHQEFEDSQLFSYGKNTNASLVIKSQSNELTKTIICYSYQGKDYKFSIPFSDSASVENALTSLSTLLVLGLSPETANERMATLDPVEMRLEIKEGANDCTVIDDSYNSDLGSLSIALDSLISQANATNKKRTLILSDILQTGKTSDALYAEIANLIREKGVERLIGIGDEIGKYDAFFSVREKASFNSTNEFLSSNLTFDSEAILIKGSRKYHFELISDRLSAAAHETVLEVNLSALERNYKYFRSCLKPTTKLVSMVKAYAYGTGDIEVAKALQSAGADVLAVAVADEGEILRKAGITLPIIVMNPEMNSFGKIFQYNLEPEVYCMGVLNKMVSEAEKYGLRDYPFHFKIDTGMHRLGFEPKDVDEALEVLKKQSAIKPRSVFSHLVGSDSPVFDDFTQEQFKRFDIARNKVKEAYPEVLIHILNSAGIERFSDHQFDMVRLGIGHYGFSAVPSVHLEETCTLKTKILQIREVSKEETVGYSRKGVLSKDSVIAAIPIGYADGLDRHLGNRKGKVLVNGHEAEIVGNVCMDVCMIDITGIPAKEGDDVIIFGPQFSINRIADCLGTISYEVLSGIARRVKRIYVRE